MDESNFLQGSSYLLGQRFSECMFCFEICTPNGSGVEKVGHANFKTKHTEHLTQEILCLEPCTSSILGTWVFGNIFTAAPRERILVLSRIFYRGHNPTAANVAEKRTAGDILANGATPLFSFSLLAKGALIA